MANSIINLQSTTYLNVLQGSGGYSSEATLNAIEAVFNNMPDTSTLLYTLIAGDCGTLIISRASTKYGILIYFGYGVSKGIATRKLYGGTWGEWVSI